MKRLSMVIFYLAVIAVAVQAQKVTFFSPEFELGVRQHLELDVNEDVLQSHTDTITSIDLSGWGIRDIRDVVYLTAVKDLDLSYNQLWDVSPLLTLDSLRYVDVSNNMLENVSILATSLVDSMVVDVTNNYIEDFSFFFTPTLCRFNIIGMDLQMIKDAPYFDVHMFYAELNRAGKSILTYRGYTNMSETPFVECGKTRKAVQLDGETRTVVIYDNLTQTTMARLFNSVTGDTTWVLPPMRRTVNANDTVNIVTGLPEGYSLGCVYAQTGTVTANDRMLTYKAPAEQVADTIYISYYQDWQLRGFTKCYINSSTSILTGDVDGDGKVSIDDAVMSIDYLLGGDASAIIPSNADCDGDGKVSIDDAVMLIDYLLKGAW